MTKPRLVELSEVNRGIVYPMIKANNKLIDNNNQIKSFFLIIRSMVKKTKIYDIKSNYS